MKNIFKSLLILLLLFSTSCTTKIGKFTVISTDNVRGLEYSGKNREEFIVSEGKSCNHRIYLSRAILGVFTLGVAWFMPSFDISMGDEAEDRVTSAVEDAIKSGKNKGVFDGDLLVNATIKERNIIIPILYGYKCILTEGEVVSSVTRTKGFLEKK